MTTKELRVHGILAEIEAGQAVSQRRLANRLGIALGLTNLLMRRMVARGWIQMVRVSPRHVRYRLTPSGLAAKNRMARAYLENVAHLYMDARERIARRFATLSSEWPFADASEKRIVLYGPTEISEIGCVCLIDTDLHLVGVVDHHASKHVLGRQVYTIDQLKPMELAGQSFDCLVVMPLNRASAERARLAGLGFTADRLFWL